MRGATRLCLTAWPAAPDFNPRSPCGERRRQAAPGQPAADFNPRSPCGERRLRRQRQHPQGRFQSTLPMRGATWAAAQAAKAREISIHAPHAGSDLAGQPQTMVDHISIHAPHAGSDSFHVSIIFLIYDFNPRSPCGERPRCTVKAKGPREFQSTLPMRGATENPDYELTYNFISIHAPHAGSDPCRRVLESPANDFNPRSPCGERLLVIQKPSHTDNFNPRSPCGERLEVLQCQSFHK